jgi:alkyl hydroperoxide reductase subunit AhpC
LQPNYEAIQAAGAELLAISADNPAQAKDAITKVKRQRNVEIEFPLLGDPELKTIDAYNVRDPLNPRIARPMTYIIDESGVIRWKFLDVRGANRLKGDRIVTELKGL